MSTQTVLKLICVFLLTRFSTSNRSATSINQTDQYHRPHHSHHKCPGHLITYRDRCFLVPSEHFYGWYYAVKYCKKHGMGLFETHSNEELQFVSTLVGKISKFWVGLYTTNTGEIMSLSHHTWNLTLTTTDINDTHTRHCVVYNNVLGHWDYRDCKEKNTFVCNGKLKDVLHFRKLKEHHHPSDKTLPVTTIVGIVIAIMAALALMAAIYYRRSINAKFREANFRHSMFSKLQEQ